LVIIALGLLTLVGAGLAWWPPLPAFAGAHAWWLLLPAVLSLLLDIAVLRALWKRPRTRVLREVAPNLVTPAQNALAESFTGLGFVRGEPLRVGEEIEIPLVHEPARTYAVVVQGRRGPPRYELWSQLANGSAHLVTTTGAPAGVWPERTFVQGSVGTEGADEKERGKRHLEALTFLHERGLSPDPALLSLYGAAAADRYDEERKAIVAAPANHVLGTWASRFLHRSAKARPLVSQPDAVARAERLARESRDPKTAVRLWQIEARNKRAHLAWAGIALAACVAVPLKILSPASGPYPGAGGLLAEFTALEITAHWEGPATDARVDALNAAWHRDAAAGDRGQSARELLQAQARDPEAFLRMQAPPPVFDFHEGEVRAQARAGARPREISLEIEKLRALTRADPALSFAVRSLPEGPTWRLRGGSFGASEPAVADWLRVLPEQTEWVRMARKVARMGALRQRLKEARAPAEAATPPPAVRVPLSPGALGILAGRALQWRNQAFDLVRLSSTGEIAPQPGVAVRRSRGRERELWAEPGSSEEPALLFLRSRGGERGRPLGDVTPAGFVGEALLGLEPVSRLGRPAAAVALWGEAEPARGPTRWLGGHALTASAGGRFAVLAARVDGAAALVRVELATLAERTWPLGLPEGTRVVHLIPARGPSWVLLVGGRPELYSPVDAELWWVPVVDAEPRLSQKRVVRLPRCGRPALLSASAEEAWLRCDVAPHLAVAARQLMLEDVPRRDEIVRVDFASGSTRALTAELRAEGEKAITQVERTPGGWLVSLAPLGAFEVSAAGVSPVYRCENPCRLILAARARNGDLALALLDPRGERLLLRPAAGATAEIPLGGQAPHRQLHWIEAGETAVAPCGSETPCGLQGPWPAVPRREGPAGADGGVR
jgi:hypothetical protein